jgi:phage gp16-like protein
VPIVIVFTKYDRLVATMKRNMDDSRVQKLSPSEVHTSAKKLADTEFKKITSVLKRVGRKVHYLKVSSMLFLLPSLSRHRA